MSAHEPSAVELAPQTWRPICACGWRAKALERKEANALKVSEKHAAQSGCGKRRFSSKGEAERALLQAKVARGLRGNNKRREESAYPCPDCPGGVWHLTSRRRAGAS